MVDFKETQTTSLNEDQLLREEEHSKMSGIQSVAIPWALIAFGALCAAISTVMSETSSDSQGYLTKSLSRILDEEQYTFEDEHAPLFPLTTSDYTGCFCATIGLMIAAGGGIGGGGILVPIYILVMGFSPKHAIPLSNITVFGGALANTYLNAKKRHPLADRPLVDWDLILVMEPLTIAGALVGAFLNKVLPEELLTFLLVALLSFTAYNTLKKAMKMYKIESEHMKAASKESELTMIINEVESEDADQAEDSLLENMQLHDGEKIGSDEEGDIDEQFLDNPGNIDHDTARKERDIILTEEKQVPMGNIITLVVMFVVVLFINLMKGGGAFPSPLGILCGSSSFWAANLFMLGWIFMISLMARSYLIRRFEAKRRCGYKYVEGDIKWDGRATIIYPIVCALAGFFAGMFGVGGGIVKGPLMLAMGVHPKVSSASSATMIFFTSFTATTSFIVFGLLVPDYAFVCLFIGFTATYVGQIVLYYLMNKYQRNSYIAFSIGGVVLLSAFLMTIESMVSLAEGGHHHHSGGICGKET